MAIAKKGPAPAAGAAPNFGDLGWYVAGGFKLPPGLWAMVFTVQMHLAKKADGTPVQGARPRLAVIAECTPIDKDGAHTGGAVQESIWGMGTKAHESWQPNPDTGKGLLPVANPNGNQPLNPSSGWGLMLKSLYDCGLPEGVFVNDLSALDGIWVRTENVPEPDEWKNIKDPVVQTGEAAVLAAAAGQPVQQQKKREPGHVTVVSEILEDGMPWSGGGGVPELTEEPAAPTAKAAKPAVAAKPATTAKPAVAGPKAMVKKPAKVEYVAPEGMPEELAELAEMVEAAATQVLELDANAKGCSRLILKTGVYNRIAAAHGDEHGEAAKANFFADGTEDALNLVLARLGYEFNGSKVVPA